jgi:hypothetical protein
MVRYLKIDISDRFGIMLFRLLDRENIGCFNYATLRDILEKIMKPNYKRIVREERARYTMYGLDINWPPRKKPEAKVIIKESKPIIKYREVIKEKTVYVDRPVNVYVDRKPDPPKKKVTPPITEPKVVKKVTPPIIEPKVVKKVTPPIIEPKIVKRKSDPKPEPVVV